MNVKSILIWATAIGTLSSCMSNEGMYDPEKAEALKVAKYEAAFVKKYGKVDPKQDWGFGEAETKVVIKEKHDWESRGVIVPESASPEEVKRVTEWFNSNPNPETLNLDWCNFWIIPISKSGHSGHMNQVFVGEEINDINGGVDWKRLVENGNTKVFKYHNSETGQEMTDKYTIQKIGEHYYLAYYYYGTKWDNGDKVFGDNDGIYDDWIFRLVPAEYKNTRRIMAEDLAVDNKSDFDFNDVVFDAVIINGEAVITLQAIGGTLPLCVGDESHEVHDLFGVGEAEFVNTQSRGEKAPVMFRIPNVNSLKDIKIIVDGADISAIQAGNKNMNAPAKLCCPTNYKWADEKNSIDTFFPKFKEAVGNSGVLWYEDGATEWQ